MVAIGGGGQERGWGGATAGLGSDGASPVSGSSLILEAADSALSSHRLPAPSPPGQPVTPGLLSLSVSPSIFNPFSKKEADSSGSALTRPGVLPDPGACSAHGTTTPPAGLLCESASFLRY